MERDRRRVRPEEEETEAPAVAPPAGAILGLQQSAGNAAVTRMLSRKGEAPAKLKGVKVNHERVSVKPGEPGLKFSAEPAGLAGVTYKIEGDGAEVDAGTTVAADGSVTIGKGQAGGRVKAVAELPDPGGNEFAEQPLNFVEDPGAITGTSESAASDKTHYRGDFTHTFKGGPATERAHVNEKFGGPLIAKPESTKHTIQSPFGAFELTSNDPGKATDGWDLDGAGTMTGVDHVSIQKSLVDARDFIPNASRPKAKGLPASFSVDQAFHALRMPTNTYGASPVAATTHVRTLRETAGSLEVVLSAGGKEVVEPYEGPTVFRKAAADKTTVEASTKESVNTVSISAEAFGADTTAYYKIEGEKLGCTVDASGTLTVGSTPGTVRVRVGDKKFASYDEVAITVTAPKVAAEKPKAQAAEGVAAGAEPPSE